MKLVKPIALLLSLFTTSATAATMTFDSVSNGVWDRTDTNWLPSSGSNNVWNAGNGPNNTAVFSNTSVKTISPTSVYAGTLNVNGGSTTTFSGGTVRSGQIIIRNNSKVVIQNSTFQSVSQVMFQDYGTLRISGTGSVLANTYLFQTVDLSSGKHGELDLTGSNQSLTGIDSKIKLGQQLNVASAGSNYAIKLIDFTGATNIGTIPADGSQLVGYTPTNGLLYGQAIIRRGGAFYLVSIVPEPGTIALLGVGCLILLRRPSKRRR